MLGYADEKSSEPCIASPLAGIWKTPQQKILPLFYTPGADEMVSTSWRAVLMGLVRLFHRYLVRQTMPSLAAAYYDRLIESVASFYLKQFCDETVKFLPRSARILDIGTGTGQLPVMLAMANRNLSITGIDLSRMCLALAAQHARETGVSDYVAFERVNIENDEWNIEPFDLIISTCSLHHWRRPANVLRAARKLLRQNGSIWILDDAAEATGEQRRRWIARVQKAAGNRLLFRTVYTFESRFLAYSKKELIRLGRIAGLRLAEWKMLESPFFIAKFVPVLQNNCAREQICP